MSGFFLSITSHIGTTRRRQRTTTFHQSIHSQSLSASTRQLTPNSRASQHSVSVCRHGGHVFSLRFALKLRWLKQLLRVFDYQFIACVSVRKTCARAVLFRARATYAKLNIWCMHTQPREHPVSAVSAVAVSVPFEWFADEPSSRSASLAAAAALAALPAKVPRTTRTATPTRWWPAAAAAEMRPTPIIRRSSTIGASAPMCCSTHVRGPPDTARVRVRRQRLSRSLRGRLASAATELCFFSSCFYAGMRRHANAC